jgi:hypothetical protein
MSIWRGSFRREAQLMLWLSLSLPAVAFIGLVLAPAVARWWAAH